MRKVLQQLKQYKRETFLCIGLTALEVIMEILMPFITAMIIDHGLEVSNLPAVYRYGAYGVPESAFRRYGRKECCGSGIGPFCQSP